MKKNSFIKGTLIASISIILVKLLGAIYVIPFYRIIGETGGALYSYAYNVYNLFLNISTAGIPVAISMIISEYYTLGFNEAKERANRFGKLLIGMLSFISFFVIFIFADKIALFLTSGITLENTISDIALAIRAISICLLINPFLSVLRGYLQGHKYISVSSISQIIEQVVRIVIVILGSYISIRVLKLNVSIGVTIALTGAFFGGVAAYTYLKFKSRKDSSLNAKTESRDVVTDKEIFKKIISYSLPLVFISVLSNLYDTIDLKLIIYGLNLVGYTPNNIEVISSIIVTWAPKICMIIVAVSMGLQTSLIPHIVSSYVKGDKKEVNNKFNQAVGTMLVTTIPMTLAIIFLTKETYYIFYGKSFYGPIILIFIAVINIFLGVLTVINTALQGIKEFKIIYLNTFIGLLINTLLDIPLVLLFNKINMPYIGTIVATVIGCVVSYIVVYIFLRKKLKFKFKPLLKIVIKLIVPTILMGLSLFVLTLFTKLFIHVKLSFISAIIKILIIGSISLIIYLYAAYKNGLLYDVLGKSNIDKLLLKFKLKREKEQGS